MARLNMDTIIVKNSCDNIKTSATDFNQNIDSIFVKLSKLEDYGLWVGEKPSSSVKQYLETTVIEKNMYVDRKYRN